MVFEVMRRFSRRLFQRIYFMRRMFGQVMGDTRGATAIEYGLFAVVLGFVLLVGTPFVRNATVGSVNTVSTSYSSATAPAP